jgi:hypothetical protein
MIPRKWVATAAAGAFALALLAVTAGCRHDDPATPGSNGSSGIGTGGGSRLGPGGGPLGRPVGGPRMKPIHAD